MSMAGEIDIAQWSPTQFRIEVTNEAEQGSVSIVLDADALDELRRVIERIQEGDLPGAVVQVDRVGAPLS